MAAFYAELQLEGRVYPLRLCRLDFHQDTDARGRVIGKVRPGLLFLTADVPEDPSLEAWAAASHKPLAGRVVFYDLARQVPHETIAFAAGHCVYYGEDFFSGSVDAGAYVCHLGIAAPAFELLAGGPAATLATAGAGWVGPSQASETPTSGLASLPGSLPDTARSGAALSPALAAMLASTLLVAPSAGPSGPADFETVVKADLQAIYNTLTGRRLLESLHASGKKIYINYGEKNSAEFPSGNWSPAFYQTDGVTPGSGIALKIGYNPIEEDVGRNEWNKRPPGIGLAHELIHAEQAAYGRMRRGTTVNPVGFDADSTSGPARAHEFELETIGIPPYDQYSFSENKIRAEWNPPQTVRRHY